MKKKISSLKVKSFITDAKEFDSKTVKGGHDWPSHYGYQGCSYNVYPCYL